MTDETRNIESVKFAQESAKQIITLSTAIVTFIFGAVSIGALEVKGRIFLFSLITLTLLALSIISGLITLFSLSGILSTRALIQSENPLNSTHYRTFGRAQFVCFVIAIFAISLLVLSWPERQGAQKIEISVPSNVVCKLESSSVSCANLTR